jgi:hypothetical protein
MIALGLAAGGRVIAQPGGGSGAGGESQRVRPTGPAAKKADDLIRAYTSRIEKEIDQGRKEIDLLRAELHELIDIRYEMSAAIADLHGELAAKGTYSTAFDAGGPLTGEGRTAAAVPAQTRRQGMRVRRDLFYGLGSALPKDPTHEQREELRRLAPRAELKRMVERLRAEVDETRDEVDQLAYKLLELRAGVPVSYEPMGRGGMGIPWFGSMGVPGSMM